MRAHSSRAEIRATCAFVGLALAVSGIARIAVADGDPLAEAAKREQERREKLRRSGAAGATFTEEDLANTKGRLANEAGAGAATGVEGESKRGGAPDTGRKKPLTAGAASPESKEQYWRDRVAEARFRVEEAQSRNNALQRMILIGQPARYDSNGRRVIYSASQMKARADAAAAALASAQTALENLLEEGRRADVLPGWLR
jgi:hypothetical protein